MSGEDGFSLAFRLIVCLELIRTSFARESHPNQADDQSRPESSPNKMARDLCCFFSSLFPGSYFEGRLDWLEFFTLPWSLSPRVFSIELFAKLNFEKVSSVGTSFFVTDFNLFTIHIHSNKYNLKQCLLVVKFSGENK